MTINQNPFADDFRQYAGVASEYARYTPEALRYIAQAAKSIKRFDIATAKRLILDMYTAIGIPKQGSTIAGVAGKIGIAAAKKLVAVIKEVRAMDRLIGETLVSNPRGALDVGDWERRSNPAPASLRNFDRDYVVAVKDNATDIVYIGKAGMTHADITFSGLLSDALNGRPDDLECGWAHRKTGEFITRDQATEMLGFHPASGELHTPMLMDGSIMMR